MDEHILIVDDDRSARRLVAGVLNAHFNVVTVEAENGQACLDTLKTQKDIKLIIMDLDMPVMNGQDTLKQLVREYLHIPVIVLTGSKNMHDAVEVMKNGAFDFLSKPIEQERLIVSARNGLKMSLLSKEISRLQRKSDGALIFSDLIGHDGGLKDFVRIGRKVAAHFLPALIMGETGTGKEMFAHAIHGESMRAGKPFVAVNCGALPEKLVESALFGHEKGAFTGAADKALGKFREADGGTLFLDEVGELSLDAQVKLLRVLQQKEIEPVGAGRAVKVDVRVISATNRDLAQDVREGRFREDLYFRLNVLEIELPPLRQRAEDIDDLVRHFVDMFCASHYSAPKTFSPMAMARLKSHAWSGNVRELENTVNRAMALCDHNIIEPDDLYFADAVGFYDGIDTRSYMTHFIQTIFEDGRFKPFKKLEQEIIADALAYHNHNISKTARELGIAKSTLYSKMQKTKNVSKT